MTKHGRPGWVLGASLALCFLGVAGAGTASRKAAGEVTVVSAKPDVMVKSGGASQPAAAGMVLKRGDEISSDPDGSAVLAFGDNATVTLRPATVLRILSFGTPGDGVKTETLLKMGEVNVKVVKAPSTSDVRVKSSTTTTIAGEATVNVLYDLIGRVSVTSVTSGTAQVDPTKGGLATVGLAAGKEVQVSLTATTPTAGIGHAGVPAGVLSRSKAGQLVLAVIAKNDEKCAITVSLFGMLPTGRGWTVSARVNGKKSGWAVWKVVGSTATAGNPIARAIVHGCH